MILSLRGVAVVQRLVVAVQQLVVAVQQLVVAVQQKQEMKQVVLQLVLVEV
jgi:hypothetical protein